MLAIVLTPSVNADLGEIWMSIAADNPGQADDFIDLIDEQRRGMACSTIVRTSLPSKPVSWFPRLASDEDHA